MTRGFLHSHTDPIKAGRRDARFRLRGLDRGDLLALKGRRLLRCLAPATHSLAASWLFCLELEGGLVLQLCTDPVGTRGWEEVGCLIIDSTDMNTVLSKLDARPIQEWPLDAYVIAECEALVYEDQEWRIESGIELRSTDGRRLVFTSGVPPGSVSVALESLSPPFEPEMPYEDYQHCTIEADVT